MKKLLTILAFLGVIAFSPSQSYAQDPADTTKAATEEVAPVQEATTDAAEVTAEEEQSFHQALKDKFIEGGVEYMWPILICLILGLAISIERIITLNLATTNTTKLLSRIEDALAKGGIEAAKDVTKN